MGDQKIEVYLDPDLREIVPGYLENRKKDIQNIQEALTRDDFELIQRLAHSMKGSGGGYGFDGITEIGASMEQAAKNKNSGQIREEIEHLKDYLSHVKIIFGGEADQDAA